MFLILSSHQTSMVVFGLVASILLLFVVKSIGKRGAYLISLLGSAVCFFTLAVYGFVCLPSGQSSTAHGQLPYAGAIAYLPLIAFFALRFFATFGLWNVIWLMMSEVFPAK